MKNFLIEHCFTKSGRKGLNSKVSIHSWWLKRGFEKELAYVLSVSENIPEAIWVILNGKSNACKNCGSPTNFKGYSYGYFDYCSNKCSTSSPDRNLKIKNHPNREIAVQKSRETQIKKYGSYFFSTKEAVQKIKKTKLEKYGNEDYNNRDKQISTCLAKYGANSFFGSQKGISLIKEKRILRGGSFEVSQESLAILNNPEKLLEMNTSMGYVEMAEILNVTPKTIKNRFEEFSLEYKRHPSRFEKMQAEIVSEFSDQIVIYNDRKVLDGKELDIFFPEYNLAIELNGIYWHSYNEFETSQQRYRHYDKRKLCEEKGIRLIQITDKEWKTKRDIVCSIIRASMGIFDISIGARKCEVREVTKKEEKSFFTQNHIQGFSPSTRCIGLYFKDELIQAISFSKPRLNKNFDWEIVRLATKLNWSIAGGISKLKNHFPEGSMVSYCDLDKFTGKVYRDLGFFLHAENRPSYFWYSHKTGIISRYKSQKKKLPNLLGESFNPEMSEAENMFASGFRRYWNSGQAVYIKY